jgi:hypothetical protein
MPVQVEKQSARIHAWDPQRRCGRMRLASWLWFALLAVTSLGCNHPPIAPPTRTSAAVSASQRPPLVLGLWESIDHDLNRRPTLTLRRDGVYEFRLIYQTDFAIAGGFVLHDDLISFTENAGSTVGCAGATGIYRYAVRGHQLTFTLVRDECAERKAILGKPWNRPRL